MTNLSNPEPAPVESSGPAIVDLVTKDLQDRKEFGIQKYGMPLRANNGRDALKDAYEESLDQTIYLRQMIEERDQQTSETVQFLRAQNRVLTDEALGWHAEVERLRQALIEIDHGPVGYWNLPEHRDEVIKHLMQIAHNALHPK